MNAERCYFVRMGGELRGPFGLGHLKDFAEAGAITPQTEVAEAREGPWVRLEERPERATVFPQRVALGFRPTEFAVANTAEQAPVDLREVIADANKLERTLRLTEAAAKAEAAVAKKRVVAEGTGSSGTKVAASRAEAAPIGEVEAMVREVAAKEALFAPPLPPPPKKKLDRRWRVVVLLGVPGNLALWAIPVFYGPTGHTLTVPITAMWVVLFNGFLVFLRFALPKE